MQRYQQGRYNGVYMHTTYTYLHKGFYSLATIPHLSPEAKKRLKWMDYYRKCQKAAKPVGISVSPEKPSTAGKRDTIPGIWNP